MAAYFIGFVKLKDKAKMGEYVTGALPTIAASGGAIVGRGKLLPPLVGSFIEADSALIVKFESAAAAKAWYDSPAYQALIPLRDQAATPTFIILEE